MYWLGSLVVAVLAFVVPLLTRAAASGRIRHNPLLGIRLRWTTADERASEAGHRAAAAIAWWAMLPAFALAVVSLFTQRPWLTVLLFIALLLLIGGMVWIAVVANSAALRTVLAANASDDRPEYLGGGSSQE